MKIKSDNKLLNGLELSSLNFFKEIKELLNLDKYKLDNGNKLINKQSPVFKEGVIIDWANKEAISGNILFFLLKHTNSPYNNNIEKLSNDTKIDLNDLRLYTSNKYRYPNKVNYYSTDSIMNSIIPNWLYNNVFKDEKYNKNKYILSRGIKENIAKTHGIKDLSNLTLEEYNNNLSKNKKVLFNLIINKINSINISLNNNNYLKEDDKKNFINSSKILLSTIYVNEKDNIKDIEQFKKLYNLILNEKIEDIDHSNFKNTEWLKEYYYEDIDSFKRFSIVLPYTDNNNNVLAFTRRTTINDPQKYIQIGKTNIDLKINGKENLFIIEGLVDKMSLLSILDEDLIKKSTFVTLINASQDIPYNIKKMILNNPKINIFNFLDNDNAGKQSIIKINKELFKNNRITNVIDFSKYLNTNNILINDLNDILNNNNKIINDFIINKDQYRKKIVNKDIIYTNIIYNKNIGELLQYIKYKKKINNEVYIFLNKNVYKLDEDFLNKIKKLSIKDIEQYILNNGKITNNIFLENGKYYYHELINKKGKVFLIEDKDAFIFNKNIYQLPETYNKNNENESIIKFIYENKTNAYNFACDSNVKQNNFLKINSENNKSFPLFKKYIKKLIDKNLFKFDLNSEELIKVKKRLEHELKNIELIYNKWETEDKKYTYLEYFSNLIYIVEQKKKLGIQFGVRGSANASVLLTVLGLNNMPNYFLKEQMNDELLFPEIVFNPEKMEVSDIDTEYNSKNKNKIAKIYNKLGYYLPIVISKNEQTSIHPCSYCKIPKKIEKYFNDASTYIPLTTKELSPANYDELSQKFERPFNYEKKFTLKMKDVLNKDLPQITQGVQKVLLLQKNIKMPQIEKIFTSYKTKDKKIEKLFLLKVNPDKYINTDTNEIYSKKDLLEKFNMKYVRKGYLTNINNLINKNLTIPFLEKYFPNEIKEYEKILEILVTKEDLIKSSATFRPAFTGNIYIYNNNKYYPIIENENIIDLKNINTNEILPIEKMNNYLIKLTNKKVDKKIIEIENKKTRKNIPYNKLVFFNYTEEELLKIQNYLIKITKKEDQIKKSFTIKKTINSSGIFNIWENLLSPKQKNDFHSYLINTFKDNILFLENHKLEIKPIYLDLKENEIKKKYFSFLNISNGFILYQEQMILFIKKIANEYLKNNKVDNKEDFIKKWDKNAEFLKKYISKSKVSDDFLEKVKNVLPELKKILNTISNSNFKNEAYHIINNQFYSYEKGSYLYKRGHAKYVGFHAMLEGLYKKNPNLFNISIKNNKNIHKYNLITKRVNKDIVIISLLDINIDLIQNILEKNILNDNMENLEIIKNSIELNDINSTFNLINALPKKNKSLSILNDFYSLLLNKEKDNYLELIEYLYKSKLLKSDTTISIKSTNKKNTKLFYEKLNKPKLLNNKEKSILNNRINTIKEKEILNNNDHIDIYNLDKKIKDTQIIIEIPTLFKDKTIIPYLSKDNLKNYNNNLLKITTKEDNNSIENILINNFIDFTIFKNIKNNKDTDSLTKETWRKVE